MAQISSSFRVKPQVLEQAAAELDGMNQKIETFDADVLSVRQQIMSYGILNRDSILAISKSLKSELAKSRELTAGLHEISGIYEACEKNCLDAAAAALGDKERASGNIGIAIGAFARPVPISGKIGNNGNPDPATKIVRTHGENSCIMETDADGNVTIYNLSEEEERIFSEYKGKGFSDEEIWNVLKQHMGPDGTISCAAAIVVLKEMREKKIMQDLTKFRKDMEELPKRKIKYKDPNKPAEKIPSNYKDKCGDLTVDQLRQSRLIKKEGVNYKDLEHCKGKSLAKNIYENNSNHVDGVEYRYYESFEEMIKENPEPITNIVCSWDQGGDFGSEYGHAMLISRIEDGKVYFIDNRNQIPGYPAQRTANSNTPQCMNLEDFKREYLKGNKFNGATVCQRKPAAEGPTCPL